MLKAKIRDRDNKEKLPRFALIGWSPNGAQRAQPVARVLLS